MKFFMELVASGLVVGALYGLIAMGFATIYRASRVVNFAQGEVMMLIAYIAYTFALRTGASYWWVGLFTVLAAMALGALIERTVIRPMLGQSAFSTVMVTIGLAVLIRSLVVMLWDAYPHDFPSGLPTQTTSVFGIHLESGQLAALATYVVCFVAAWAFFRFSILGVAMRAAANDSTVALLMGIPASHIYTVAWVLAAVVSGLTGVLFAEIYHLGPEMSSLGIRAFPATILGGLDSVLGSAIGGLIIGVVENLAGGYLGSGFKEIAGFVAIIVILMIRPNGLFGSRDIERV